MGSGSLYVESIGEKYFEFLMSRRPVLVAYRVEDSWRRQHTS